MKRLAIYIFSFFMIITLISIGENSSQIEIRARAITVSSISATIEKNEIYLTTLGIVEQKQAEIERQRIKEEAEEERLRQERLQQEEQERKEKEIIEQVKNRLTILKSEIDKIILSAYLTEDIEILDEIETILSQYSQNSSEFQYLQEEYEFEKNRFNSYKNSWKTLTDKLKNVDSGSFNNMDMLETVGFSEEELIIFIMNIHTKDGQKLTTDYQFAYTLSDSIISSKINELLVISIMIWETNWLRSEGAKNNNFGGLMYKNELMHFDSPEKGVAKLLSSIRKNFKNGNTVRDINETYCVKVQEDPDTHEITCVPDYAWTDGVLSIMRQITETEIGG